MSIDVGAPGGIPNGATYIANTSGNLAATAGAASIAITTGRLAYLSGFLLMGCGATATSIILITITGLQFGTWTLPYVVVAGVTLQNPTLFLTFPQPLLGAVANNIAVNVPSFGAGNTNASISAWGYIL